MAKVLIHSPSHIGKYMAGPAIRAWEFAKALATRHQVILLSSGQVESQTDEFKCLSLQDPSFPAHFEGADVLITQRLTIPLAKLAASNQLKVIVDAYCPTPLELLEYFKKDSLEEQQRKIASEISTLVFSFKMADGILCASETQRDLWIGFLMAHKIITPSLYHLDPTLRSFITVVPFGLSSTSTEKNGKGMREKLGLHTEHKVLIWGGGIWNWFDPLSLIKAMKMISLKRSDIKLVFMGVKPPDPLSPAMSMGYEAMQLAQALDLTDHCVFFHQEWVPYEQRQNFLLDADLGISTHFEHLETHFAFRTRILDYLWTELPMITTHGDSFADLIEREDLGRVVPYENPEALADVIVNLLDDKDKLFQIKKNIDRVRKKFFWSSVISPLDAMIEHLNSRSQSKTTWQTRKALLGFLIQKVREKGLIDCCRRFLRRGF